MPVANVRISKGSKTLHGWYIHPIPYEMSIKDFFDKLVTSEISPECNISINSLEIIDRIELSQTLGATAIQTSHRGWSSAEYANTQGKKFVSCLSEAIWYIDMHGHKKFEERSYHIPELFLGFFGRANPESYKASRKPFNAIELNLHCQALALHTTLPWIFKPLFTWLREPYNSLITTISNYVSFLQQQNKITTENHASTFPVRNIEDGIKVKIHQSNIFVTLDDKIKYHQLENALNDLPLWTPIDIENYLPTTPVSRMHYVQGLSRAFTFKLGEFRFNSGNNAFNAISIWKIDSNADETTLMQQNTNIVNELQVKAPHYHTRAMKASYLHTCDLLLPKAKPAALCTIYRMLTGDSSAPDNPTLKDELIRSVQQPINLVRSIFERQSLKEIPFKTFDAATEINITELWETIHLIDNEVTQQDRTAESITKRVSKVF
ncbi:20451_t:CDS:2 [Gigaspora rosea]|nr:20451_t:CDS:2 [Gigaspora rosea]